MGNKKRILAWILSLAMVFGLFGGQASVAKAGTEKNRQADNVEIDNP